MQETWVRSLNPEDPLEKEMATHFSILAWEIPWTEDPAGPHSLATKDRPPCCATTDSSKLSEVAGPGF